MNAELRLTKDGKGTLWNNIDIHVDYRGGNLRGIWIVRQATGEFMGTNPEATGLGLFNPNWVSLSVAAFDTFDGAVAALRSRPMPSNCEIVPAEDYFHRRWNISFDGEMNAKIVPLLIRKQDYSGYASPEEAVDRLKRDLEKECVRLTRRQLEIEIDLASATRRLANLGEVRLTTKP